MPLFKFIMQIVSSIQLHKFKTVAKKLYEMWYTCKISPDDVQRTDLFSLFFIIFILFTYLFIY